MKKPVKSYKARGHKINIYTEDRTAAETNIKMIEIKQNLAAIFKEV